MIGTQGYISGTQGAAGPQSSYLSGPQSGYGSGGSFLFSAIIGAMTNSWFLGGLFGGSYLGGAIGDAINSESDSEACDND